MLVDTVTLIIKAGNGGDGAATFRRDAQTAKGGPDGGNGGNGGNVYFVGSHNITDLREFRYKKTIAAQNGVAGKRKNLFGKNAPHIYINVPLGTQITNKVTGSIAHILRVDKPFLAARGGTGGRGNVEFATPTNRTPTTAEKGGVGEEKQLLLELTLIAEVGLVGLPNAGKSSLLTVLTNASPKIGAYPFTTLEPTIGMFGGHPIADIPGLIAGASTGKGLGLHFLRHIEKTKVLLHCMDVTRPNIVEDYHTIKKEFGDYNTLLLEKPEVIVLNKIDLVSKVALQEQMHKLAGVGKHIIPTSVYDKDSIAALKAYILKILGSQKELGNEK